MVRTEVAERVLELVHEFDEVAVHGGRVISESTSTRGFVRLYSESRRFVKGVIDEGCRARA